MNRRAIDQARYCLRALSALNRRKRSADSLGQKDGISFFFSITKQWHGELVMIRHSLASIYFDLSFFSLRRKKKRELFLTLYRIIKMWLVIFIRLTTLSNFRKQPMAFY